MSLRANRLRLPFAAPIPGFFWIAILISFSFVIESSSAQGSAPWITKQRQEGLVQRVRAVLPSAWTITRTAMGSTPDDWYTQDNRGFEIDGENAGRTFRVWFLPKDWIGIRRVQPQRKRLVYWEGILSGGDFKLIANSEDVAIHEVLQAGLHMFSPSIVNSGWQEAWALFKDRLSEIDVQTGALVSRFCLNQQCRDESAYSLIVLGIPALSLTLECAVRAEGIAQEFCASALGYWGRPESPESVRVLNALVSDPSASPEVRRDAAHALGQIADPASGPALLQALRIASPDAVEAIVIALEKVRYESAAPEILLRMLIDAPESDRVRYAKVLATLGYKEAAPAIQRLCKTTTFTADWMFAEQAKGYLGWVPEIALMRLTAPWGRATDGIRLLLLPPEYSGSRPTRTAVVIENVGNSDQPILGSLGTVFVDGKDYGDNRSTAIFDGNMNLSVNDVYPRWIDLTGLVEDGAPHRVEYRLRSAISNSLTVQIPAANR